MITRRQRTRSNLRRAPGPCGDDAPSWRSFNGGRRCWLVCACALSATLCAGSTAIARLKNSVTAQTKGSTRTPKQKSEWEPRRQEHAPMAPPSGPAVWRCSIAMPRSPSADPFITARRCSRLALLQQADQQQAQRPATSGRAHAWAGTTNNAINASGHGGGTRPDNSNHRAVAPASVIKPPGSSLKRFDTHQTHHQSLFRVYLGGNRAYQDAVVGMPRRSAEQLALGATPTPRTSSDAAVIDAASVTTAVDDILNSLSFIDRRWYLCADLSACRGGEYRFCAILLNSR